jgi:DNA-binding PadR family transcriptional regulator
MTQKILELLSAQAACRLPPMTGRELVNAGASQFGLYAKLYRLEDRGLIVSNVCVFVGPLTGRRHYTITEKGREAFLVRRS